MEVTRDDAIRTILLVSDQASAACTSCVVPSDIEEHFQETVTALQALGVKSVEIVEALR